MTIDNEHDYVLVLIMVILVNNHDDSCGVVVVMLLVIIYVYVHICCWWIFMHAMMLNSWSRHVMNNVGDDCWSCANICIVVDWVICSCIVTCCCKILCIQLFGLIIQVVYDVFVASWDDDLGGDLVPHAYRCRV